MAKSLELQGLTEEYIKQLYERLTMVLAGTQLSNKALSRILRVSEDVVEAWVKGSRYPKTKYLGDIASACNVSVEYLLCKTDNPKRITKDEVKNRFYGRVFRTYIRNNAIDLSQFTKKETEAIIAFCEKVKNGEILIDA
ncbi:MAG: helix-turn-helix transcriptional regulator [Oscillospiraceae bacterium]|nr:helix-turn-helix transcriptional regulator [Oscillospiraceae bacterium]